MNDVFDAECVYHIYSRAIGNEKLFQIEDNYGYFLEKYDHFLGENVQTLAYCLIPNHFHFLIKINRGVTNDKIVKAFSDFLNSYSKSINKVFERSGALFQRKFKRKKIDNEDYLSRIVIYIHLNPMKHNLTEGPLDWKYSSFRSYLSKKHSKLNREMVLEWFGGLDGFKLAHQTNTEFSISEEFALE
ncbi:transposase [Cyclobacterium jeungdonense]|uniref:Transposase n=1 Tax=Cyclobacterium jeungdonense TaxID=708087 RepID=A0ABT8C208_9BACT|nr:transposase [Cyclobacterium jeungdonense]MDN3686828.1 transposase [Cyclobacterium jeungdonense]